MWDDPAYPGVLHNAFVDVGIPCFTPEVGAARVLDREMIALFVEGHDECAEALWSRQRIDRPHGDRRRRLHRKQRLSDHRNSRLGSSSFW